MVAIALDPQRIHYSPMILFSRSAARLAAFALLALAAWLGPEPAQAHPHVWVVSKTKLLFDPDGNLTGIHHDWTFDKPFSSYVTTGLDTNRDGILSEEELQPLAKENTDGLAEFGYFTKVKIAGKEQAFDAPITYSMTFADGALTQHFDLPLKTPAKAPKIIGLEVYDTSYFIDFSMVSGAEAVTMSASKTGCTITVTRPKQATQADLSQYSEDYFANAGMGLQYASKAVAACP